jgi:hypothetical protein
MKSANGDAAAFFAVLCGGTVAFEGIAKWIARTIPDMRKTGRKAEADLDRTAQFLSFFGTYLAAYLAIRQLRDRGRRTDLMLFAVVRAGDILLRGTTERGWPARIHAERHSLKGLVLDNIPTLVFSGSCFIIMWCWFYEPRALPKAYSKWISRMSELHPSLHRALRLIREGRIHYGKSGPNNHLLFEVAEGYNLPEFMGDISAMGPDNPHGFQQMPCLLVHKGLTDSCPGHWKNVWVNGFKRSILIYLPIHFLARAFSIATRKKSSPPIHYFEVAQRILKDAFFSTSFLSTFITLVWMPICTLRSHVMAPGYADTVGYGPGLGSFLCGFSILLERKSRRRELALFVLPRAIYALGFLLLGGRARLAEAFKGRRRDNVADGPPIRLDTDSLRVWERILVDAVAWPAAIAVLVSCYRSDKDFWFGKSGGIVKFLVGFIVGDRETKADQKPAHEDHHGPKKHKIADGDHSNGKPLN